MSAAAAASGSSPASALVHTQEVQSKRSNVESQLDRWLKHGKYAIARSFEYPSNAPHLNNSRSLINRLSTNLPKESRIIVMGPSALEPLAELVSKCASLVLVDFDESSLHEATKQFSEENKRKISLIKCDLTGGAIKGILELGERLTHEKKSPTACVEALTKFLQEFEPKVLELKDQQGDYVVSSLMTADLTHYAELALKLSFVYMDRSEIPESAVNLLDQAANQFEPKIQKAYTKFLVDATKPEGMVYFADTFNQVVQIPDIAKTEPRNHPLVELVKAIAGPCTEAIEQLTSQLKLTEKIHEWRYFIGPEQWQYIKLPNGLQGFVIKAFALQKV